MKIKLSDKEKKIARMLDEMPVNSAIQNIKKELKIENKELIEIIEKLEILGVIQKVINNNELWYFINRKKIDDKLRFNLDMGYEFGKGIKDRGIK